MIYEFSLVTCQGQLYGAQVAAKLVVRHDDQRSHVQAPNPLQLQGVLVVVGHAHLMHPGFVHQRHPSPGGART